MKLRTIRTLVILMSVGIMISIVSIVLFRTDLSKWFLKRHLSNNNITSSFTISKFSGKKIKLNDIKIANSLIKKLEINFKHDFFNFPPVIEVSAIHLIAKKIDYLQMIQLADSLFPIKKQGSSNTINFLHLQKQCNYLSKIDLQINISEFIFDQNSSAADLIIKHLKDSEKTSIQAAIDSKSPQIKAPISTTLNCQEDKISMNISNALLSFNQKTNNKKTVSNTELNLGLALDLTLDLGHASLSITNENLVNATATGSFQFKKNTGKDLLDITNKQFKLLATLDLENKMENTINFSGNNFDIITSDGQSQISSLNLYAKNINLEADSFYPVKSTVFINDLSYSSLTKKQKKKLLSAVNIKGNLKLNEERFDFLGEITDKNQSLHSKKVTGSYWPKKDFAEINIPLLSTLNITNNLSDLIPFLDEYISTGSGTVNFHGNITKDNLTISPKVQLHGKNITTDSKFLKISNLNFNHSTLQTLTSSSKQIISLDKLTFGPSIESLMIRYDIKDNKLINVSTLNFNYEEALISADNFLINLTKKNLSNFQAKLTNLDLEKLLKLLLKDTIKASGKLSGHLDLSTDDNLKKPVASGSLTSTQSGWIRYRPPGSSPPDPEQLPTDPVGILNSYLYDFNFDSISADFKIDSSYNMTTKLQIFGRNPSFLPYMPLKLNINLEQNILVPIKTMMLTYQLPDKIKEKIDKIGIK